jgi:hypothetical protein
VFFQNRNEGGSLGYLVGLGSQTNG